MKKLLIYTWLPALLFAFAATTFTSCSDDDDNNFVLLPEAGVIITPPASNTPGWSGDFENGTATYTCARGGYDYDEEEDIVNVEFYSMDFKDGICQNANYCVEITTPAVAAEIYNALITGSWMAEDDEEEDDEEYEDYSFKAAKSIKNAARRIATRAGYADFGITVYLNNGIIYIPMDGYRGKSATIIKDGISSTVAIPENFTYGTYDSNKGEYICNYTYGLVCNGAPVVYKVNVEFTAERYLKSYITTVTTPNTSWAEHLYEREMENAGNYRYYLGVAPEVTINNNVVIIKAITNYDITNPDILENIRPVPESEVIKVLKLIDKSNSEPFIKKFF